MYDPLQKMFIHVKVNNALLSRMQFDECVKIELIICEGGKHAVIRIPHFQFFSRRPPAPPPPPPMEVSRRGHFAQSRALPAPIPTIGNNHINDNNAASAVEKSMIARINAPDHRFTATHGVALAKGRTKEFV